MSKRLVKVTKAKYIPGAWHGALHVQGHTIQEGDERGYFHQFSTDSVETAMGHGNYPCAIVEMMDGSVRSCALHEITFLSEEIK
jgi:hypothetical protein